MSAYAFPFTEIVYPDSDGLPVAESDFQREYLIDTVEALRGYFRERDDVYVSGNLFIYYEEGNPKAVSAACCNPCMKGSGSRRSTRVWALASPVMNANASRPWNARSRNCGAPTRF